MDQQWIIFIIITVPCLVMCSPMSDRMDAIVKGYVARMMATMNVTENIPVELSSLSEYTLRGNMEGNFHSAVHHHYRYLRINDIAMCKTMKMRAEVAAAAAKSLSNIMKKTSADDRRKLLHNADVLKSFYKAFSPYCFDQPSCDLTYPYRLTCGACNNLMNPVIGKAFTVYRRIVPSAYDDGIDQPRQHGKDGLLLPSARRVSNIVHDNGNRIVVSSSFTPYLTHFAQFVDHDIASTPVLTDGNDNIIEDCCLHPNREECFNIRVEADDPFYRDSGRKCMHFVRSDFGPSLDCFTGIRQQLNQRSSFIDGSAIYGFNQAKESSLRENKGGLMRVSSAHTYRPGVLPESTTNQCDNVRGSANFLTHSAINHCFDAGDHRHTESPLLAVIHTMFLRRHNLIAEALRAATGIQDDEVLFQEAKRIIVAELQHIIYTEYLPSILNEETINTYSLRSTTRGHNTIYDPSVDPRTINSFTTAAYRFGHSFVQSVVGQDNGQTVKEEALKDNFGNPTLINIPQNSGCEYVATWMMNTGKSETDRFLVGDLRNRLFDSDSSGSPGATLSFDLSALNIQRGRDHGLPGYNVFREWCGRPKAQHFGTWALGLVDHDTRSAAMLQSIYRYTDDIDLFAGGLSEKNLEGSLVGPTFNCIIAFQFNRIKFGDRFWYENKFPVTGFNEDQLNEIKRITMSKIICSSLPQNARTTVQPRVFRRQSEGNLPLTCDAILEGTTIGYNFKPFADELIALGGRRYKIRYTNPTSQRQFTPEFFTRRQNNPNINLI